MLLTLPSSVKVIQELGSPSSQVQSVNAIWTDDPVKGVGDYPCGLGYAPVISERICHAFEDQLLRAGKLVQIFVEGVELPEFKLLLVNGTVDCLDVRKSSRPSKSTGVMKQVHFVPELVDESRAAFVVPQAPFVFWSGAFVNEMLQFGMKATSVLTVWSEDPAVPCDVEPMR